MPERGISWLPGWVPTDSLSTFEVRTNSAAGELHWTCQRPRPGAWHVLGEGLRRAAERLCELPLLRIVSAIDAVATRWGNRSWPARRAARDEVVRATGFSPAAVDHSFDVELRNYRADSLWAALRRELRDPRVLDQFRPDARLAGAARAIGPRATLTVFTGNVPGLPALSIVRCLLVKSAVLAKVASGEPTFAARFAATLADEEPLFGQAIAVTYWSRDDHESLSAALGEVDAVIAYGSDEAVRQVRTALRDGQRYIEHGHKLSAGYLARDYRAALGDVECARRVAADACAFNQLACIAPRAYFVEANALEANAFAGCVATAMEAYAEDCPPGTLDPGDASMVQLARADCLWRAGTNRTVLHDAGLDWTVAVDDRLAGPPDGHRFLRLIPVKSLDDVLEHLRPHARHLQNFGLGVLCPGQRAAFESLAVLGTTRLCEPGKMATPSMAWRHDGEMCVARLLRWCDVEMHGEADNLTD